MITSSPLLLFLTVALIGWSGPPLAQRKPAPAFTVIPLGIKGGIDESNLSAYLCAAGGTDDYICLDAGTLHYGLVLANRTGAVKGSPTAFLRKNVKAYLVSHPHLDHVAGLVINSPDDSSKNIYGFPFCLSVLQDKYFSWKSWANFGDLGEQPALKKYHYAALAPGLETEILGTPLRVTAYFLSHAAPGLSSAFLIRNSDDYLLYLGDTGADSIEHSIYLQQLWTAIAPLITEKKLKAIFIETSFPDSQPPAQLFGHLTPALLMQELHLLSQVSGGSLQQVPIVITHMKPGGDKEMRIKKEVLLHNNLHLKILFPIQGKAMYFR